MKMPIETQRIFKKENVITLDSFIYSLNATVPVFAVMILGYFLKQWNIIDEHFAQVSNKFVFKICLPCMVFQDLADTDIRHNFDLNYIGFCFFATLVSILAIWILTKRLMPDPHMTGAFVQGAYRSSAAILGIAFIQNIYGTSGMAPLMIIGSVPLYNIFAVVILTLESGNSTNDSSVSADHNTGQIKSACIGVAKNPIIIGIVLGLLASYFNLDFPKMVDKSIHNLAVLASPLALLAIGATFEGRKAFAKIKPTVIASCLKLVVLAAVFLPLAVCLGFRDQKLVAIIIMLASPCTPTSYIMAKNMNGDDVLAASIVVSTTLFSSITLTGWIFIMRCLELIQ